MAMIGIDKISNWDTVPSNSNWVTTSSSPTLNLCDMTTATTTAWAYPPIGTSQENKEPKENKKDNLKGENKMKKSNNMFGKVENGLCRLSMNGGIAVKTSTGYKTYNLKKNRLTNCSNFVFDVGEEFFFIIPTNKVVPGDIILISGKPKCVINLDGNMISVINYEDSTIETILPERHIFMGNSYFYGKIISMFGNSVFEKEKGTNKIFKYMMISEMMNGSEKSGMLTYFMMSGIMDDIFDDLFDFEEDDKDEEEDVDE